MPAVQVQFTIDDGARGAAIAELLLQDGLAACVQRVGPIRSRYRWEGAIEEAEEWLFLCKTTTDRLEALTRRVAEAHPYDTPEIIATEVVGGLDRYLIWVEQA
ncbi:MAG TPA: divalent-cation tolerance protein CutA [Acidimicrobiales bacterium]|nr:divalent-cation tolerance protein CutA [Acidimicrobiales bacterium]